jgi:hypothetical protein
MVFGAFFYGMGFYDKLQEVTLNDELNKKTSFAKNDKYILEIHKI